ncbi:hypothetical protein [Streptomyces sp. NPDC021224]|uniref:restriction endonuclease-related protein n=1 Tax=unclassified Streptomyces TaxID=2593676 RepID=UPI0037996435
MTEWPTRRWDDPAERADRVVAASLRAAYAWTVRHRHHDAMREVARMTGVVMEVHGPGRGPTTPLELVDCLKRRLGTIPALAAGPDGDIARVALLDSNGLLTTEAYDLAGEYALPVSHRPGSTSWMPAWTWMHADRLRSEAFQVLAEERNQELYVASRRFLIDHPAGDLSELRRLIGESGVKPPAGGYGDIPAEHVHRSPDGEQWWWPCPFCRWPMAVRGTTVRCRYGPHAAVYRLAAGRTPGALPRLSRVDEGRPRMATPTARPTSGSVCVDFGVWRFVVVPGASETRIMERLVKQGATVELWPEIDRYDLRVLAGSREFRVDVKEYRSAHRLIADLRAEPPQARVLLPRTHEHQRGALTTAVPSLQVTTETAFVSEVRRALRAR